MAALLEAYITNLGKYAEGQLVGETLKFPTTAEEVQSLLKRIGVDGIRYRNRINAKSPLFQELLACCDRVYVQSEKSNRQCYHERNRYMVLSSDRVIAVYDGRSTGGTFYTIRFAQANEKEIRIIEI